MNRTSRADGLAAVVAAYCEAIEIPDFDEAAIGERVRVRAKSARRARFGGRRIFAIVAAAFALLVVFSNNPAVVAGVDRVLKAFTIAGGRTIPLTTREVDLSQARSDMPFVVIAPPALASLPHLHVVEMTGGTPPRASVIFELRSTPERQVTIVENKAAPGAARILLAIGSPEDAQQMPVAATRSTGRYRGALSLRGYAGGRVFAPLTWVTRGTRIVLISPPGAVSATVMRLIRRAMSR